MGYECGYKVQTPCSAGSQLQAVKPRHPVFFLITECISFIKDSPFSWCKFAFKGLSYATWSHAWPGLQCSLPALHQLSIWPSVILRPKQKISRGFAREQQRLVRRIHQQHCKLFLKLQPGLPEARYLNDRELNRSCRWQVHLKVRLSIKSLNTDFSACIRNFTSENVQMCCTAWQELNSLWTALIIDS